LPALADMARTLPSGSWYCACVDVTVKTLLRLLLAPGAPDAANVSKPISTCNALPVSMDEPSACTPRSTVLWLPPRLAELHSSLLPPPIVHAPSNEGAACTYRLLEAMQSKQHKKLIT